MKQKERKEETHLFFIIINNPLMPRLNETPTRGPGKALEKKGPYCIFKMYKSSSTN